MGRAIAANAFGFIIIALIALAGLFGWAQNQFKAEGPLQEELVFQVQSGANLIKVSRALFEAGAITDQRIFRIGAKLTERDTKLKYGEYILEAGVSMDEILDILVEGKSIEYKITIPEGLYTAEIVERINANEDLTGEIETLPPEGYLAPNTYSFLRGDSRQSIIDRMHEAQLAILDEAWAARDDDLPLEDKEDLLILASIVESEAGGAGEWGLVASVFYNRMANNIRLQADATIRYGLTDGKERLRRGLRESEINRRTAYNTYLIDGLTPTPISNPGKQAIMATAQPETSPYFFFVLDGSGGHVFAKTYQEHRMNVRAWREIEAQRNSE